MPLVLFETIYSFLFYVRGCFDCMYVCVPVVCSAHGGQKSVELLGVIDVVSYHVGTGTKPRSSAGAASALNFLSHLFSSFICYFK